MGENIIISNMCKLVKKTVRTLLLSLPIAVLSLGTLAVLIFYSGPDLLPPGIA
jgi:hypothetical protein